MSLKLDIEEKCTGKKLKVIFESGVAFFVGNKNYKINWKYDIIDYKFENKSKKEGF